MGIESDHLVFDYLSRVGDLAHSTRMTAAERAKLVGGLRGEIDRARAADGGAVTKAAVQKILDRLGRPEDVVASASGGQRTGTSAPTPSTPAAPADGGAGAGTGSPAAPAAPEVPVTGRPSVPGQRTAAPSAAFGASSPHLASLDELGAEDSDPDWWRVDPGPFGNGPGGSNAVAAGEPVPGFVGGIELPELLKPPTGDDEPTTPHAPHARTVPAGAAAPGAPGAEQAAAPAPGGSGVAPGLGALLLWRRRRRTRGEAVARRGGFVELAAAVLLVAGAVLGSLIPLAAGWLAAWWSPKLSRTEAKWAALGMPGLVLAGAGVWLWGRTEGRWGEPLAQGGDALREAMGGVFPVFLRVAAAATALYLVWRARRPAAE
ncbi:hypothetical protein [Streptomyces reniochalinae]|uniref:Uncharacterized protein n=1 Tax=Streptomyces reniochalinae TaxID=2250578 RepID=A0A367ELD0_9ACTN|nr:hypothetical protein [Streptomyces reniochalinae]RCG18020.1 hypothetical protein DQ392_15205 [Streptomyces reniochalinae]